MNGEELDIAKIPSPPLGAERVRVRWGLVEVNDE